MPLAQISRPQSLLGRLSICTLLATLCAGLGACDQSEKTRKVIDQRAGEAQQTLEAARKPQTPTVSYDPLTVTDKVWGGSMALRMQHGMPLPERYETPRGITLISADPMTLADIVNAIGAQTGIPMRLSALSLGGRTASAPATPVGGAAPSSGFSGGGGFVPAANKSSSDGEPAMPISYEGTLSGLMERVSAYFGVSWRYDGSSILVSRYETHIFTVEALPGTQEINEGMQDDTSSNANLAQASSGAGSSGGSGGGSSSGGSQSSTNTITQNSKITMGFKYWEELTQVLNSIVGSQGSVVVSPSMGTVTITTTPEVMETVADYLKKENKRNSRQIAINVQIYSVDLVQSEDFSIAFSGFLKNLSKFSGLNYNSAGGPGLTNTGLLASSFGSLSVAILNGPNDPTAHAGDIFNALSTIGDTTSVAQFPMTTLNNRTVSRRVGTDQAYIATVTQSTVTTTSTQNTYTPTISTVHDGFSLQLTPRLLDDGRILLQYSLSLIGLDTIGATTFNTGTDANGNPISIPLSLPITDNRIFVQQSALRSGSTLIIGGVDQEKMAQNKNGVGSPDNFLLGGGVSSDNDHLMLFMAITPQVMDTAEERD